MTTGCPAIFIRLHFCNLKCQFKNGFKCDADYTWSKEGLKEMKDIPNKEVAGLLFASMKVIECNRLVFTGGEPMLQIGNMAEVIDILHEKFHVKPIVEIETNGTIKSSMYHYFDQINCSPKLSSSGNKKELAIKPEVLKEINNHNNSWFKFVYTGKQDINEIQDLIDDLIIDNNKVILMPEGVDPKILQSRLKEMAEICMEKGWRMCNRLQIETWGNKRRT